jgi:hypothetical protein
MIDCQRVFLPIRLITTTTFVIALTFSNCLGHLSAIGAEPAKQKLPSFDKVRRAVEDHFAHQKGRQRGDLIWRAAVAPVYKQLEELGWKVENRDKIQSSLLPDNSFLVQIYNTGDGRDFLRDCGRFSQSYDRLDHLSRLPDGELTIRRLIAGPDGYKMLEYMTTAPGGEVLGEMLSESPNGDGFNQRTGRIYTVEQFIARLQKSYNDTINPPKRRGR